MNSKPLVSVITVCYNAAATIEQTIKSVLGQTYPNVEYIIIDGKSKDNTLEIVNKYRDRIAQVVSEPDKGIYDAMNKGIALTAGQLIGIINADDWYESDAVENMVDAYLQADNRDNTLYYGMLRIWRDGKEYCIRQYHHNFVTETVIQHPTNFVPKALYERLGAFDDSFRIAADYDMLNRFRTNNVKFCKVDKVISNFRLGGASDNMSKDQMLEMPKIQLRYGIITQKQYDVTEKKLMSKPSIFRRIKRAVKYVLFG